MIVSIDLGGTKLATALFSEEGQLIRKDVVALDRRSGKDVGLLITGEVAKHLRTTEAAVTAIGVSVPGISHPSTGRVWAPNIPGWDDYPLVEEIRKASGNLSVAMDSDRACCILGEAWKGNARGCRDAIFLAVGTGIGAGILIDGRILRGAQDIAGAVGWMALDKPFQTKYTPCGCFEYYASGDGIAKLTRELLSNEKEYHGILRDFKAEDITAHTVFEAFDKGDALALRVFDEAIQYWGMAVANLISIFNPEKIIFGGGVFGPALKFLEAIREQAGKWAQPVSMKKVLFQASDLGGDAALYGAGFIALDTLSNLSHK
jgi:glucokinase